MFAFLQKVTKQVYDSCLSEVKTAARFQGCCFLICYQLFQRKGLVLFLFRALLALKLSLHIIMVDFHGLLLLVITTNLHGLMLQPSLVAL